MSKDECEGKAAALKHRLGPWRAGSGGESAGCLGHGCSFAVLQGRTGYFLTSDKACMTGERLAGVGQAHTT